MHAYALVLGLYTENMYIILTWSHTIDFLCLTYMRLRRQIENSLIKLQVTERPGNVYGQSRG
jgi:hypothetical protein